jgi:signal recognition particle receptor subunit beta
MLVDHEAGDAVIVVAFVGASGSGKQTTLRRLCDRASARNEIFCDWETSEDSDTVVSFEYRPRDARPTGSLGTRLLLRGATGLAFDTRRTVLACADIIVFVADSDAQRWEIMDAVSEMVSEALEGASRPIPVGFQLNKRDAARPIPVARLRKRLNIGSRPVVETSAATKRGIAALAKLIEGPLLEEAQRSLLAHALIEDTVSKVMAPIDSLAADITTLMSTGHDTPIFQALGRGKAALDAGRYSEAAAHAREALAGGLGHIEARLLLIDALLRGGDRGAAMHEVEATAAAWLELTPARTPPEDWDRLIGFVDELRGPAALRKRLLAARAESDQPGDFL